MTTLLFSHPSAAEHDTGHGHPERADRIRAVLQALDAPEFEASSGASRRGRKGRRSPGSTARTI